MVIAWSFLPWTSAVASKFKASVAFLPLLERRLPRFVIKQLHAGSGDEPD
jgi:hypothetical protein